MPEVREVATENTWTTRKLLAWMTDAFTRKGLDSPRLSAEILLSHVLGAERMKLYMDPDRPASAPELATLRGLAGRALKDEPVQYLTGRAWFFGLELAVDRRVLVPRPCTETMVETVIQRARVVKDEVSEATAAGAPPTVSPIDVLDLCTGSGCVGIAIAKNVKGARVVASDISPHALAVAQENAARCKVDDRIDFRAGDLWDVLAEGETFDVIVANPPYIPDDEWPDVPANVKLFEPALALRGGPDGLTLVRRVIEGVLPRLKPGGLLMVEVAASRAEEAKALAEQAGLTAVHLVKDLEAHNRFITAQRAT
jgi:release factor glutamine methyltransferase